MERSSGAAGTHDTWVTAEASKEAWPTCAMCTSTYVPHRVHASSAPRIGVSDTLQPLSDWLHGSRVKDACMHKRLTRAVCAESKEGLCETFTHERMRACRLLTRGCLRPRLAARAFRTECPCSVGKYPASTQQVPSKGRAGAYPTAAHWPRSSWAPACPGNAHCHGNERRLVMRDTCTCKQAATRYSHLQAHVEGSFPGHVWRGYVLCTCDAHAGSTCKQPALARNPYPCSKFQLRAMLQGQLQTLHVVSCRCSKLVICVS